MAEVIPFSKKPEGPPTNMAEITIRSDGTVTFWLSDDIETIEQFNWVFFMLALAGHGLINLKGERFGQDN